jgi:hypothetical protein
MPLTEREAEELFQKLNDVISAFIVEHKERPEIKHLSQVSEAFPEDLRKLLAFEEKEDYYVIKPVKFLGSENFKTVAGIVRLDLGGEYISMGKESHFRVPKSQA